MKKTAITSYYLVNHLFFIFLTFVFCLNLYAQNVAINNTGDTAHPSALLDLQNSEKGFLIPRVALTATNTAGPIS
jgi:hypothetical protein